MPHPWTKQWNRALLLIRATLLFTLFFLLLGPIVKQINNIFEKPLWIIQVDNSRSLAQQFDSLTLQQKLSDLNALQRELEAQGYEAVITDLQGSTNAPIRFDAGATDLSAGLRQILNGYEGKKIEGVLLVSDGIYTQGSSPLFATYNFPVYTVGLGDSVQRTDVAIRSLAYNKISYQGNRFPIQVELETRNFNPQPVTVTLRKGGRVLAQQQVTLNHNDFKTVSFEAEATEKGLQKYDVAVTETAGETNLHNNRATAFLEVVAGRKKILLVAPAPHPDLKALQAVINKNNNYTSLLYVPGVTQLAPEEMAPANVDLAIFHQAPDAKGRLLPLFQQYMNSKVPVLVVAGAQTDLRALTTSKFPLLVEAQARDYDDVTAVVNPAFAQFTIDANHVPVVAAFPPVSVHFGRITVAPTALPILYQQVGSLATQKPLLMVQDDGNRKTGLLLGEGIWRWRLFEYDRTENTAAFDELFGKVIQFLSTTDDRRKFRSYPLVQTFPDSQPVVIESQVFNDLYELVYGQTIDIVVTNEHGKQYRYSYVTSPGNTRYQIGSLPEGVYRYRASTVLNTGNTETSSSEFVVVRQDIELQNLTADFGLLRKLASSTGGKYYPAASMAQARADLTQQQAAATIVTEETFKTIVNLKWIFWVLVALFTAEWFARKYWGSY